MKCQVVTMSELSKNNPSMCLSAKRMHFGCHTCQLYYKKSKIRITERTDIKALEALGYIKREEYMVKPTKCESRIVNPEYERLMEEKKQNYNKYFKKAQQLNKEIEAL